MWEELAYQGDVLTADSDEAHKDEAHKDEAHQTLVEDLAAQARSLFWLPQLTVDDDLGAVGAVACFLPRFQLAVDAMRSLHTFVSKPMRAYRELQPLQLDSVPGSVGRRYPISA